MRSFCWDPRCDSSFSISCLMFLTSLRCEVFQACRCELSAVFCDGSQLPKYLALPSLRPERCQKCQVVNS